MPSLSLFYSLCLGLCLFGRYFVRASVSVSVSVCVSILLCLTASVWFRRCLSVSFGVCLLESVSFFFSCPLGFFSTFLFCFWKKKILSFLLFANLTFSNIFWKASSLFPKSYQIFMASLITVRVPTSYSTCFPSPSNLPLRSSSSRQIFITFSLLL